MTQSHEIPERVVVKDKIEYRVDVQEVVIEGNTSYTYDTLDFPIGTPTEVCERKVVKAMLAIGNLTAAKEAIVAQIMAEDKAEWVANKLIEYEALEPEYREMTNEEKLAAGTIVADNSSKQAEYDTMYITTVEYVVEEFDDLGEVVEVTKTKEELSVDALTYEDWYEENKELDTIIERESDYEYELVLVDKISFGDWLGTLEEQYTPIDVTDETVQTRLETYSGYDTMLKTQKLDAIEKIEVEHNTVAYDAHTRGRADMTGVIALANYQFIKALAQNMPEIQPIYDAIYKSTIDWKGKDNKVHNVQVESVAETAIKAMEEYANVIGAKK